MRSPKRRSQVLRKTLQKRAKAMGLKASGTRQQICNRINAKLRRSKSKRRSVTRKPRKLQKKLKQTEFYSVASRKRVNVKKEDIKVKKDKRGRHRMVAKDPKTGAKLFKYVKESKASSLKRKFN
jgi:hypothetical protein